MEHDSRAYTMLATLGAAETVARLFGDFETARRLLELAEEVRDAFGVPSPAHRDAL